MIMVSATACSGVWAAAVEGVERMNQQFFKLFAAESKSVQNQSNVLMSPWSVQQVFGMLALGARGETLQEINEVFGLDKQSTAWFEKTVKALESQADMNVYNGLVVDRSFQLNMQYVHDVRQYYSGRILWADFARQAEAAAAINGIIEKHSRGLFKNVLKPNDLSADTVAMLLNVLYFKSSWLFEFDKSNTHRSGFTAADKSVRLVDMMYQKKKLPYFKSPDGRFHGVILPYKNHRFELIATMPSRPDVPVSELLETLISGEFSSYLSGASAKHPTKLYLPKFDLDSRMSLTALLYRNGLKKSFSPVHADFQTIGSSAKGNIYLSNVLHLVKLKIDETGTEGAAVTMIMVETAAMPVQPPQENIFRADRPFLLILRDRESGAVIFSCLINTLPAVAL